MTSSAPPPVARPKRSAPPMDSRPAPARWWRRPGHVPGEPGIWVLVWLALMALTVLSWLLGSDHGLGNSSQSTASLLILAVAVFKIRLVGLHFMELRHAPGYLRAIFETFCAALFSLLVGMYLFGG